MKTINTEIEKNVWNEEVDKFEKTLKPEDIIEGRRYKIIRHKSKLEKKEEKEKDKISSMIKRAENTCKELGFKEGTEKFAECGLKLYTKNIDKISEKKDVVIVQSPQTTSTSNTMTIYDPVRDSRALINQGMKMLSGRCTLGIDC